MKHHGFTLVEAMIALGAFALLLAFTLPTFAGRLAHARRADATLALERIQIAQERHRALHGLYAHDLSALNGSTQSPEGLYSIALEAGPGDGYTAVAVARADGPQADDTACAEIVLRVEQGFATLGPTPRCLNR
jgi:prepilin-type N-terminal cleavage/methylation domain-containing protein